MPLCKKCGICVNDIVRHRMRNRCEAQHIRKVNKPARGLRHYGSKD